MVTSFASSVGDAPTEIGLETDGAAVGRPRGADGLLPGELVGRFVILSRLGAGGMGVVYAAHDPELDRKLALKLLRPGLGGNPIGRARLLREAQALARLSHPNVVAVHDVGTLGEQVWIAMEFVEGRTLGEWLRGDAAGPGDGGGAPRVPRRRTAEVLAVIVQAGQGVAAAHAAGLLHRDLKPDNIMVGQDGRVRVMDFGLARPQLHPPEDSQPEAPLLGDSAVGSPTAALTEVGTLVGTPAYMAPEQFLGKPVDARTDQFSLCVTLWEALYGERPFVGATVHELCIAVTRGERRPVPRGARVPAWLRRVCERGLSVEPDARFPSVEALLRALERGRVRARRQVIAAVVVAAATAAVGSHAWQRHEARQQVAACEAEGASIEAVWGPDARAGLREAFTATDARVGPETADRVTPWLDRYASEWSEARSQACMDARVRGTWSEPTLERAQWCLDEHRSRLQAQVATLVAGGTPALVNAVAAAASLPSPHPCRDQAVLERLPLPPPEDREPIEAVREVLSRADAERQAGRYDRGLALADDASARARALGWPPLLAAAHGRRGELLAAAGRYAEAEAELESAYFEARKAGAIEVEVDASTMLIGVVGRELVRPSDGLLWSRQAELALFELGHEDALRKSRILLEVSEIQANQGLHAEVAAALERALALQIEALGPEHPELDGILNHFAILHSATGDRAAAKAMFERVVDMRTRTLGPTHPEVAAGLNNLANIHRELGEYAKAKALHERGLAIKEQRLGPEHPDVGTSLVNLGLVHHALGDTERARALFERALAIAEAAHGRDHPAVAQALLDLALVDQRTDDHAMGRARLERALAIYERALGPSHAMVAQVLTNLSPFVSASGDLATARGHLLRAFAILEAELGPRHPHLGYPLTGLAAIALDEGRWDDAWVAAERTLALWVPAGMPPEQQADARVLLASAMLGLDRDRERALALVEAAREAYRAAQPAKATELARLESWVERGFPPPGP